MKKSSSLFCLSLVSALGLCPLASAEEGALRVIKSTVNAETENAELCLEFDKPLSSTSPSRLAANLRLEADGEIVNPTNIAASDSSLCLFPLERGKRYHLSMSSTHGVGEESLTAPYKFSFTIPDRSPSLAFAGKNGGVNEFGDYESPLVLRAVNVSRAKVDVYRITDSALMMSIWQGRAQTAVAPTESAYLARAKGKTIWREEETFDGMPNATVEQKLSLRDKMPELAPGLYLIVADAGNEEEKPTTKGLAPLAAAWFTKSDFSLRAVRDEAGVHVFAATTAGGAKGNVRLSVFDKAGEKKAESQGGPDGIALIPYPKKIVDKNEMTAVFGVDPNGNVAFAEVENLPALSENPALGTIRTDPLFVVPFASVDVFLSLAASEKASVQIESTVLRLSQGDSVYTDFPIATLSSGTARMSFLAPARQGVWHLRWQKADGTALAEEDLRVTATADAPYLEVKSDRDSVLGDGPWAVTIKSVTSSGKPAPVTGGNIFIGWQRLDAVAFGWRDYSFGNPEALLPADAHVADFLTDLNGTASLHLTLPPRPQERGLYQAVLKVSAQPDAGVAEADPLVLPLRPEGTVIGIKPLAIKARFPQNGLARFSLIGLSSDGKPRDVSNLSYQVYEEGRSFGWYQDEGRWNYKPEAQLRPVGGGALSIKADGSTVLEWPVNAGNYRVEILDPNGKTLALSTFSAGWDSAGASALPSAPLTVALPKTLQPGREVKALVTLPEPAMLTAFVADTRIRKIVHEYRGKGQSAVVFTPSADWAKTISITVEAQPKAKSKDGASLLGIVKAAVVQVEPKNIDFNPSSAPLVVPYDPSAVVLQKDVQTGLTFGLQNNGPESETYRFAFRGSPGLKIENDAEGEVTLKSKQGRSLTLILSALSAGAKELRLELSDSHGARFVRVWPMAVMTNVASLRTAETKALKPKQTLKRLVPASHAESLAFISRRPTEGLAEILGYVLNARPFTTEELALSIGVLRLWGPTLEQAGLMPNFVLAARSQAQIGDLLRHQNRDGGFAPYQGGESTMSNTAAALAALGPLTMEQILPSKKLAIDWLKQRLANTWFDEKERESRAAAYAALAQADAIDPASLHYFSDISSTSPLPALAEAHLAAAFKHIKDPDAAAFWIKKMLAENGALKTPAMLNALSQTDALSSDDVLKATSEMALSIRSNAPPALKDVASLLRAIAVNIKSAGAARVSNGKETLEFDGVLAVRGNDAALETHRNDDGQILYATFVAEGKEALSPLPKGASITRHLYRLNGVELLPPAKPVSGEMYMVGLEGKMPLGAKGATVLIQDGGDGLRPKGCPLSAQQNTLSFIPWFTTKELTPIKACAFSAHDVNAVIQSADAEETHFSIAYFAYIDAQETSNLPSPVLRILK